MTVNRFGIQTLTRSEIMDTCPSFYAEAPKYDVSDKYSFINTRDIAAMLYDKQWVPTSAIESKSVDPRNRGLTKHLIKFDHPDFTGADRRIQMVLQGSHNRESSFRFMVGVLEMVCLNGIISASEKMGDIRVRHVGNNLEEQVMASIAATADQAPDTYRTIERFQNIELSPNEQGTFAMACHTAVYGDVESGAPRAPVSPTQLLQPRRAADHSTYAMPKPNLWKTFNVIQENVLKGGLRGRATTGRRLKTRPVKAIDRDVKLNQALWTLTEKMAELKEAS